jgi:hypothetical protein
MFDHCGNGRSQHAAVHATLLPAVHVAVHVAVHTAVHATRNVQRKGLHGMLHACAAQLKPGLGTFRFPAYCGEDYLVNTAFRIIVHMQLKLVSICAGFSTTWSLRTLHW